MKKILVYGLLIISLTATARKLYVAPAGNDLNSGSILSPFATLNKAWSIILPGDTVYMRGGVYQFNQEQLLTGRNGTRAKMIKVLAYPNEYPVIKPGTITQWTYYSGILVMGDYILIRGLEVTGWKQLTANHLYYGLMLQNCQHTTIENCNIHHNGFGLCIGDWTPHLTTDITVLNCDLHHNTDPLTTYDFNTPYGGADGLRISTSDSNAVFRITGCRIYWNSDDGVDLFYNNGTVYFKECWVWMNGYRPGVNQTDPDLITTGGNGIGFKLGPPVYDFSTKVKRILSNCLAADNRGIGFDQNGGQVATAMYNNTSIHNARGYAFNYIPEWHIRHISINNISYGNKFNIAPVAQFSNESVIENCSFIPAGWRCVESPLFPVTDNDFKSLQVSGLLLPRNIYGWLPQVTAFYLQPYSSLIDAGQEVGINWADTGPDIGCFEFYQ